MPLRDFTSTFPTSSLVPLHPLIPVFQPSPFQPLFVGDPVLHSHHPFQDDPHKIASSPKNPRRKSRRHRYRGYHNGTLALQTPRGRVLPPHPKNSSPLSTPTQRTRKSVWRGSVGVAVTPSCSRTRTPIPPLTPRLRCTPAF
jgi:hypothetical protein